MSALEQQKISNVNISPTAIKAYQEILTTGIKPQQATIAALLQKVPIASSRDLVNITGVERGTICRILYNLEKSGKVIKSHRATCPITKHIVSFYKLAVKD